MLLAAILVKDVLIWILIVAGILALGALAYLFFNIAKAVRSAAKIVEDNRIEIDHTMHVLPQVIENVEEITSNVSQITAEIEPNIAIVMDNVADVSSKVNRMTGTVEDATNSVASGVKSVAEGVKSVGDSAVGMAQSFMDTVGNIGDSVKTKFYKKEQSAAEKILTLIEKLKGFMG